MSEFDDNEIEDEDETGEQAKSSHDILEKEKEKSRASHLAPWQFRKGQSGNPSGRKKGDKSLKEWAKEYLRDMDDEERMEFLNGLPKETIWKMAEGNPMNQTDLTTKGESIVPDKQSKEKADAAINSFLGVAIETTPDDGTNQGNTK